MANRGTKSTRSSEPLSDTVPHHEADEAASTLRTLSRGVRRADGFALFVAICNSPSLRNQIIEALKESMPDRPPLVVSLAAFGSSPLEQTLDAISSCPKYTGPVLLIDLEKAVPSESDSIETIAALNLGRSRWHREVNRPIVLFVPEYLFSLLSRGAPDFMDHRSDTLVFAEDSRASLFAIDSFIWSDRTIGGRMSAGLRRERIEELRFRLRSTESAQDRQTLAARSQWLTELGNHQALLGELSEAEQMYMEALNLNEKLGNLLWVATDYGNLGLTMQTRGDVDEAEKMFRKALEISEQLGQLEGIANACGNLGDVMRIRGELDEAEKMFRKALEINEKLGRLEGMATQYCNLGIVAKQRGDLAAVRQLWTKSRDLFAHIGAKPMVDQVQGFLDSLPE
ncbi:MAG: tetratricopeptide repeat protein [Phycisphaerales bacterium]|nr:MAG: tetratricopeptide repeat protein [Phycisphaerales bacterium]